MKHRTRRRRPFLDSLRSMIESAESLDRHFIGFTKGVVDLTETLAATMSLPKRDRRRLRVAALLHDIGRIRLPKELFDKEGALSPSEHECLRSHVLHSEAMAGRILSDGEILALIRHHHEWYNGQGYPDGLAGESIPLGARILAVADAYVAMTHERPHRPARTSREALQIIRQGAGQQFCPHVADALILLITGVLLPLSDFVGVASAVPQRFADAAAAPEKTGSVTATEQISARELELRIKSVVDLKALPDVVTDVMAMTSNVEACDINGLVRRIECDHALATRMLRLANSALYATTGKIDSIERAVVMLGVGGVRQLLLGVVVIDQWRQHGDADRLRRDVFWQHSMATALLAGQIARLTGCADFQAAFTAGLLHDLGQLVFQEAIGPVYGAVLAEAESGRRPLAEVEARHLGADHASVMQTVGRDWGLPKSIVDVMSLHHLPWDKVHAVPREVLPLLLCVRVGNAFSHSLGLADQGLGILEVVPRMLVHYLGLRREMLEPLLPDVAAEVEELGRACGLSVSECGVAGGTCGSRPCREVCYVSPDEGEMDPVTCFLSGRGVQVRMVRDLPPAGQDVWCWVRADRPGTVQAILASSRGTENETRDPHRWLLLLPDAAPRSMREELSEAGIPYLVEPWTVAALSAALDDAERAESLCI